MALQKLRKPALLLGTCVPCLKKNISKIKVRKMDLDEKILMYFHTYDYYFAHDPNKLCKAGDVVLIKELCQKMSPIVTHEIMELIYPMGDITDPITGKKVVVGLYRDEIEERTSRFGKLSTAFNYDEAPERGWQEDKKDFTHKESYIKYHEFDDRDQPYAL